MNSGKALDNDGSSSQVAWLQGSVLPAGALPVVVISHHNPGKTISLHNNSCVKVNVFVFEVKVEVSTL